MNRWLGIVVALAVAGAVWWLAADAGRGVAVEVVGGSDELDGAAVDALDTSLAAVDGEVEPLELDAAEHADEEVDDADTSTSLPRVTVEVVDASGALRADVALALHESGASVVYGYELVDEATTDASGRATLADVDGAVLVASAPDGTTSAAYSLDDLLAASPDGIVRIALERTRYLTLRVVDRLDRPVAGASLAFDPRRWHDAGMALPIADTNTDANGYARVSLHDATWVTVRATRDADASRITVDLRRHHDATVIEVPLYEAVEVRGSVLRPDGMGCASCDLLVTFPDGSWDRHQTNLAGDFEFATNMTGRLEVVALGDATDAGSAVRVVQLDGLMDPAPTTLRMRPGVFVEGHVRNREGHAIDGVRISATMAHVDPPWYRDSKVVDGTFTVGPFGRGDEVTVFWNVNEQTGSVDVVVDGEPIELRLDLAPLTSVSGRVSAGPRGATYAHVRVVRIHDGWTVSRSVPIADDGTFSVADLVVGERYAFVAETDRAEARLDVAEMPARPRLLEMQLIPTGRVRVSLTRPAREEISLLTGADVYESLPSNSDGTARFDRVAPGRYTIHVGDMDTPIATKPIVVSPGEDVDVVVQLP